MRRPSGIAVGLCPSGVAAGLGWSISSSLLVSPLVCLLLPSFKGSLGPGFGPAMAQLLLCRVHNYIWPWMLHGSTPRGRNARDCFPSPLWPLRTPILYGTGCCVAAPHGDGMLAKLLRAGPVPIITQLGTFLCRYTLSLTYHGVVTYLCDIWSCRLAVAAVLLVLPLDSPCGFARGIC